MTSPGSLPLLYRSALRHAGQHRWQTALGVLGILLGVMMVVAVDLANSSARRAFALSVAAVEGNISHQIVGGSSGVPDAVFTGLRTELGLRRSAPTLVANVRVAGQELTLLGLDMISESSLQRRRPGFSAEPQQMLALGFAALDADGAVLMSAQTAAGLGVRSGENIELSTGGATHALRLAATFDSPDPVAVEGLVLADIATAQHVLGRGGVLDSIDLILEADDVERLRAWLPSGLSLVANGNDSDALGQMRNAFHTNLLAMSLLALLVAGLLIYNTVSLSVLQRRQVFGVLRSLGVTRGELLRLVLGEALVLGLVASCVGTLAGLALGQGLLQLVTRTIDDLYFNLSVTRFLLAPWALLKGVLWGTGLTLLAALLPAWQAARSEPVSLHQRAASDSRWRRRLPALALVGLLLGLAGYGVLVLNASLVGGFVALNLLIFGFCLCVPLVVERLLAVVLWLPGRSLPQASRLALRNLQSGISRSGLAVAALAVAVSVTVGVGIMVGSFRDTVILWLDQSLAGDLQVTRLDSNALPPNLSTELARLPGVAAVREGYALRTESAVGEVRVESVQGSLLEVLYIKTLAPRDRAAVEAGTGVLVSEPLAWQAGLAIGDTLELQGRQELATLPVLGIFHDYTTGPGLVAMALPALQRLWPDPSPGRLTLTLEPGAEGITVATALRRLTGQQPGSYGVAANADIRRLTLEIFDRTFMITHVLRLLAVLVAFIGVLSALIALQLERMREYALLRATGMTVREVAAMIVAQTLAMGVFAGLLALPLGLLMSDILIEVINRRSFGWSMQHLVPPVVLGEALLLALGAALLAGLYPALRVARVTPAAALREE